MWNRLNRSRTWLLVYTLCVLTLYLSEDVMRRPPSHLTHQETTMSRPGVSSWWPQFTLWWKVWMKRCAGVNKDKSTGFFALDWSLWVVRDLSCYLVHHLMILPRPDPPCSTELLGAPWGSWGLRLLCNGWEVGDGNNFCCTKNTPKNCQALLCLLYYQ